jgi:hypothetical protein
MWNESLGQNYPAYVTEMVEQDGLSLDTAIFVYETAYGPITEESI